MRRNIKTCGVVLLLIALAVISFYCSSEKSTLKETTFLNLHDSVKYVGMSTCKQCHTGIHETFSHTGMGQSFDHATKQKSKAKFGAEHKVYDAKLDFWYFPFWKNDSLFIKEFRLEGKDTIHQRIQAINYIVGSGQHTNSHLFTLGGYIYQAPLTYYTQKGKWDLPPGFENGFNSRFNRIIGLECMSCHNGFPNFVKGSENKYISIPNGIDCERCHGPGEIHVAEKQKGVFVDTSKYIDYSIVNPGKLSVDLQFDLCQRCHLQGNAVLKEGKSFYDFKPGMHLKDVLSVFIPRYKNGENSFIMASHADRLKQSKCFIEMAKKKADVQALRPYKSALTCVTCHNPHVSVRATNPDVFVNTCKSCHTGNSHLICTEKVAIRDLEKDNCIICHMPKSGSEDIPHVSIHDHNIRKKPNRNYTEEKGEFTQLVCINDSKPDDKTIARAYIQQYERFDNPQIQFLDSALKRLPSNTEIEFENNFIYLIHLNYLKKDFVRIVELVNRIGIDNLIKKELTKSTWDNIYAWTAYRVGEAFSQISDKNNAYVFYKIAYNLAPYYFEFSNKLGASALLNGKQDEAYNIFNKLVVENPNYAPGFSNLGYIELLKENPQKASFYYQKALQLNPDYEPALMNLAGLYLYRDDLVNAKKIVMRVLKKNPENAQAKNVLYQINQEK
jgi:tetratricopeptide (TPR) repeat protein